MEGRRLLPAILVGWALVLAGIVAAWALPGAGHAQIASFPGTVGGGVVLGATPTWTGAHTWTINGALSAPGLTATGSWIGTGGNSTSTKPYVLIETAGATSNNWPTAGTGLGINAASGFAGRLVSFQVAGAEKFYITNTGVMYANATIGTGGCYTWLDPAASNRNCLAAPSDGTYRFQNAPTSNAVDLVVTGNGTLTLPNLTLTSLALSSLAESSTAPTVSGTGLGTSPAITANGTAAMDITVGTTPSAASFTITLPTASHGWVCAGSDITTVSTSVFLLKQTGGSTTTAVLANYSTAGTLTALVAADHLRVQCSGY